jgi:hypothetical protein
MSAGLKQGYDLATNPACVATKTMEQFMRLRAMAALSEKRIS